MRTRAMHLILAVFLTGGTVTAQNPQSHEEHHPGAQAAPPQQSPSADAARCQEMMAQRNAMMQRMGAMDKKLDELVTEMNQARGDRKVEAMAKVVSEMAAQHKEMRQGMMQMNETAAAGAMCQMMQGMMQGMMGGMMQGMMQQMQMMQQGMRGAETAPKK